MLQRTPPEFQYFEHGLLDTISKSVASTTYTYEGIGNRLNGGGLHPPSQNHLHSKRPQPILFQQLSTIHHPDGNMQTGPVPGTNGLNPGMPVPANATLTWDAENRLLKALVSTTIEAG